MVPMPLNFSDISTLPTVHLDIRYATSDNFMGRVVEGYDAPHCWMHTSGVDGLRRVIEQLSGSGLGLWIWDAYRPVRSTKDMVRWAEETGQHWIVEQGFIVRESRHNRGGAVDLSLYDMETGKVLDMGTEWDHFGPESHIQGVIGTPLDNRLYLRKLMTEAGFCPYDVEWWHFELPNAMDLPSWDIPYT